MTVAIASVAVITAIDARIVGWLTPVADVVSFSVVSAHGTGRKCSSA
jgi:hypothetical protein